MSVTADSFKTEEVNASHFAMQIALQTMKERCQLLQQRLSAVEGENLRLRIDNQKNSSNNNEHITTCERGVFEEKITQLTRQKSQLIDRITMVAKENGQLWARLSRLTEANQSLGNHLTKISDTLNKHPINESQARDDVDFTSKILGESNTKDESLEEISLKIIDTIRKEKMALEQQCEEMVELQTGAIIVEDCGFALTASGDIVTGITDDESENEEDVMEDIHKLREKVKEDHRLLKMQQAGLQAAVTAFSAMLSDKKCKCKGKSNGKEEVSAHNGPINTAQLVDLENQLIDISEPPDAVVATLLHNVSPPSRDTLNNSGAQREGVDEGNASDRICPLCCKFYSLSVPFDDFHEHVLTHFQNENDETDSVVANFEVVR